MRSPLRRYSWPDRGGRRRLRRSRPITLRTPLTLPVGADTVALMNDSTEASAQGPEWLVLIHRVPPKPDYLRVKLRRRLAKLGAVPLKNSVYVMPDTQEAQEDLA